MLQLSQIALRSFDAQIEESEAKVAVNDAWSKSTLRKWMKLVATNFEFLYLVLPDFFEFEEEGSVKCCNCTFRLCSSITCLSLPVSYCVIKKLKHGFNFCSTSWEGLP